MPERDSYEPGTPSWVDLAVDDLEGARSFYSELFGWVADVSDRPEAGGYTTFRQDGLAVAGVGPKMGPPMPDAWTVNMSVADAAASLDAVTAAGGQVVAGPMEIFDEGVLGVFVDPAGAFAGVWEPRNHTGAQFVNEPVSFVWNELGSADLDASVAFYSTVFGWQADANDGAVIFKMDSGEICGAHPAGDGEPPFWTIWFAAEDCDGTVERATQLGASVLMPPEDMSFGRGALIAAPGGAVFGVGAMAAPST